MGMSELVVAGATLAVCSIPLYLEYRRFGKPLGGRFGESQYYEPKAGKTNLIMLIGENTPIPGSTIRMISNDGFELSQKGDKNIPRNERVSFYRENPWFNYLYEALEIGVNVEIHGGEPARKAEPPIEILERKGLKYGIMDEASTTNVFTMDSPKRILWGEGYHPNSSKHAYNCRFTDNPYEVTWNVFERALDFVRDNKRMPTRGELLPSPAAMANAS